MRLRVRRKFQDEWGKTLKPGETYETNDLKLAKQLVKKGYCERVIAPEARSETRH